MAAPSAGARIGRVWDLHASHKARILQKILPIIWVISNLLLEQSLKNKVYSCPADALAGILFDGMSILSGGFGLSGNPENLIPAVKASGVGNLTVISNNCGAEGFGLWMLLDNGQIRKMISS